MLRDERQLALNDVVVAALEAADVHERSAEIIEDEALRRWLADLAAERRGQAEGLGEEVRSLGDLPRTPDADREALRDAVAEVKAALSSDQKAAVLHEDAAAEEQLEACARQAEQVALPERASAALRRLLESVAQARERLSASSAED